MKIRVFTSIAKLAFVIALLFSSDSMAQWSGTYGNGWIDYSKPHYRIGIKTKGLHKLPFTLLPTEFKTSADGNYQLFHRGVQVNIIVEGDGIIFYGEPNDGESDKWLFRPGPEARVNPYVSFFSDEGSYILTYGQNPKRMTPAVDGTSLTGNPEPYHFQKFIKTYNNQFSYSSVTVVVPEALNNCFFEKRNTYVSSTMTTTPTSSVPGTSQLDETLTLVNWASSAPVLPTLEVMMNGFSSDNHSIDFTVGKTDSDGSHATALHTLSFSGINAEKTPVFDIPKENLNNTGGVLRSKTKVSGDFTAQTYYILTYPQLSSMSGLTSLFMNFKASPSESSGPIQVGITNAESDVVLYNITDPHNPRVVSGTLSNGTYYAMVGRVQNEELRLLAARPSAISAVTADMITDVALRPSHAYPSLASQSAPVDPGAYDYLIITTTPFLSEADNYAKYRNSTDGGSYRTAVFEIKSLYNQFNYGEPSPVAIKRFVDYMLTKGIRVRHNLLLIGNSVTAPDVPTVRRLVKEMPMEVPSIGDPASDFLLVAGLHGLGQDIPAIPVGRIPAVAAPSGGGTANPNEIGYYLAKVKKYESASGDLSWRNNLIHLDGGKENETFTTSYLDPLIPIARTLDSNKPIETLGTIGVSSSIRPSNITDRINNGTGMITYYGHGGYNFTQFNIGLITKPDSPTNDFTSTGGQYNSSASNDKFPFIYFNGCGVGNAFQSRNPASTALASDWILAENRGAIAIIGSSFNSFATPTGTYLKILYDEIFTKTDEARKTIGQIKNDVAKKIASGNFTRRTSATADAYDLNNLHIANLFGDPALRILATSALPPVPLPVAFSFIGAVANGNDNITVNWKTAWEKDNSYFVIQRSPNAVDFIDIGVLDGRGTITEQTSYSFVDIKPLSGINYYRVGQVDRDAGSPQGFSRTVTVNWKSDEWLTVSPNPASHFVDLTLDGSHKLKTWKLYDIQGKKIKEGLLKTVSLDGLVPGDYIIEMEMTNNEVYSKKIVKY